ncbi:hypothetical protein LTR08_003925 [Meristemomyces frigidus]|nr:hypothetical protein LTR08_003925 [Meristemomyces frigidus]
MKLDVPNVLASSSQSFAERRALGPDMLDAFHESDSHSHHCDLKCLEHDFLAVNHQVCDEAKSIFYNVNDFDLNIKNFARVTVGAYQTGVSPVQTGQDGIERWLTLAGEKGVRFTAKH